MNKVRILHIMDKLSVDGSKITGPARQLAYRLPCYDPARYDTMICSLRSEEVARELLIEEGIEVVCLGRNKFDPLTLIDIYRIVKKWRPGVLHLHGYASWNFGRLVGKLLGKKIVLQEHFVDTKVPVYQKIFDWIFQKIYNKALGVSSSVKDFMVTQRYISAKDIEVIGNSFPIEKFQKPSPEKKRSLKQLYQIPLDQEIVGTVGRLAEMKGQKYFLHAAKKILSKKERVSFVIVGEGPLRDELSQLVYDLNIQNKVFFVGYQKHVTDFISLFDLNVIPSIFGEGFPGVAMETFASEIPLVITDLPGFSDFLINKRNALIVPPRDSDFLAQTVLKLLNDPELRIQLVANGKKTMENYSSRKIANRYMSIYEHLM